MKRLALLPALALVLAACQDITQPSDSGFRLSESPAEPVAGAVGEPTDAPSIPHQSHLGPGSLDITPASPTFVRNCIPFGNNLGSFKGFIYRNVPAFELVVGARFAFDLGAQNDVDIRRNIFFATANKNPAPPVNSGTNVVSQGIVAASGWTQVVSDAQIPQNPRGNFVKDDYELVYTAEGPFSFPGGGLIVGFGGSPPGVFADSGCEQVLVRTDNQDVSGFFYARFFNLPDQHTGVLDAGLVGGTAIELGGIVIQRAIQVNIDIKPCLNNDGNGVIPVWILGAADFDVTEVDPSTVQLEGLSVASQGKSGKLMARVAHVNGDGFADLVVQIEDVPGTFTSGSGTATLTGNLFDGTPFEGSDDICVVPPATIQMSVSAGSRHSCGVTTTGAAYCWGRGVEGQLGDGTNAISNVPVAVSGGLTFQLVSSSDGAHSCGVTTAGAAYCWGANFAFQLGDGTDASSNVPVAVSGGLTFQSVSLGGSHSCGVTTAGAAYCWGFNREGQLGDGTNTLFIIVPVAVSGGLTFQSVSLGRFYSCGVTTAGKRAYCWGFNGDGELGDGTNTDSNVPVAVLGGLTFQLVSAGSEYNCGVTTAGAAYCWGQNALGGLGDGTNTDSNVPVAVLGGLTFQSVSVGVGHSCGVTTDGPAYCWGWNGNGTLGDGTNTDSNVPVGVDPPF